MAAADLAYDDARSDEIAFCEESYGVLDDVFDSFLNSNAHLRQNRSLEDLLTPDPPGYKRYYRYIHLGIPYLATTFTRHEDDARWINIKLNCNGFTWPRPPWWSGRCRYDRHGAAADSWRVLPTEDFYNRVFPKIQHSFYGADGVCFYYSTDARRVDMKFFYDADYTHVMLTFEMGHPLWERENDREHRSYRTR